MPDKELLNERAHLAAARTALEAMRQRTEALDVNAADPIAAAYLARALYYRAESLKDDPGTALFFGRLDTTTNDRWYIGRRHVGDEHGDPLVIDWRAEVSCAFYRATHHDPMGVTLRRRFGIGAGDITAYEDEHLSDRQEPETRSAILAAEIERPRVGPMRDIVATIQPEQDEIVRADANTSVCVQGAPGTGKTAVGLHRAAWLLYAHRDRLARQGVLVIGPNRAFLDHIGAVLPALGEVRVGHTTVADLFDSRPVRSFDDPAVATLKGDARMAEVLRVAVWGHILAPTQPLIAPRGARKWRVPAYEVGEVLAELRGRGARYHAARDMLPHRLAHCILVQMERAGDSPDDRVHDAVARSPAVKAYAAAHWPALDPARLLHRLFSDPQALAVAAAGVLDPAEQDALLWRSPTRTPGAARWSAADLVLLDELSDLLTRTPSLGHIILDEAQDLSPMQLRAVGRRCTTGAATVLGDLAQGTTPWATTSWAEALSHLGKPEAHVEVLARGFRVPTSVIDFAARLLPVIAPGLGTPHSVRDNPGRLDIHETLASRLLDRLVALTIAASQEPGSVGLIVPDKRVDSVTRALTAAGLDHGVLGPEHGDVDHQVDVIPASVAKGLEFDRVIVLEPADIVTAEPDLRTGLRRLYVVLTRAVCELDIVHAQPLPAELAA
ncbi:MAG TPA: AAA family ATPase [Tetrasphaera sp.]|nr:AAA family ATPase [Tetrasphaera sp.]